MALQSVRSGVVGACSSGSRWESPTSGAAPRESQCAGLSASPDFLLALAFPVCPHTSICLSLRPSVCGGRQGGPGAECVLEGRLQA